MAVSCVFHRGKAAHFECTECGSTFCQECISKRKSTTFSGEDVEYFCPGCNLPAELMSFSNIVEPFWNNLGKIFLYPLQLTPLLLTLGLSLLGACFPDSFMVRIFVGVVMTKYAFAALQWTAQGSFKAVPLSFRLVNDNVELVGKQYLLFIAIGFGASTVGQSFGMLGAYLFYLAGMLVLPAMIMLLVATNSLINALNPIMVFKLIGRIGWPYLLMYLFLTFLYGGPAVLVSYLPLESLPESVIIFCMLFLQQSYGLIGYNLMGYVLLQYHKEIGYPVDYEFYLKNSGIKLAAEKDAELKDLRNGVAVLSNLGHYSQAIERIRPYLVEGGEDLELAEKFHTLLKLVGEKERAANFAPRYLDLLVLQGKRRKAMELGSEMVLRHERLPQEQTLLDLARWFKEDGKYKQAGKLLANFVKFYNKSSQLPDAYVELAKLFHEHLNDSSKARQILKAVIRRYPQHEVVPEAKKYLQLAA